MVCPVQDCFLVSDWTLCFASGEAVIAEQTVFIYEDYTFEMMDDNESKKGSWTFDGEALMLTLDGEVITLNWHEDVHQFSGEYNEMTLIMYMPIEPEAEDQTAY